MCAASERAMKLKVRMINITIPLYLKKYRLFIAFGVVTCATHLQQYSRQQTIFGIALYNGDTYIRLLT